MYHLAVGILLAWDCQCHGHKLVKASYDLTAVNRLEFAKFLFCKINGIKYAMICDTSINNKQQAKAKISASHFKVSQ